MKENIFFRIKCYDIVIEEDKAWFFCAEKNILCEFDRLKNQVSILTEIEEEENEYPSYCSIKKISNKLILIPWTASRIIIFDLKTKVIQYITLEEICDVRMKNDIEQHNFWTSFIYEDYVYLAGFHYPAIIKIDISTMKVEYLKDWLSVIEKNTDGYVIDSLVVGTDAWLSCGSSNLMVKLNLINNEFEYYKIPVAVSGLGAFAFDGEFFWIAEWKYSYEKLICWSPIMDKSEVIKIGNNLNQIECRIHSVIDDKDKIILFPFSGSRIYQLDKKNGEVSIRSELEKYYKDNMYIQQTYALTKYNANVILWVGHDFIWHEYNLETNTCVDYEVGLNDNETYTRNFLQRYTDKILIESITNKIVNENMFPIKFFLDSDVGNKKNIGKTVIGERIYKFLIE